MNARSYEKLYGMRLFFLLLMIVVCVLCISLFSGSSILARLIGSSEVTSSESAETKTVPNSPTADDMLLTPGVSVTEPLPSPTPVLPTEIILSATSTPTPIVTPSPVPTMPVIQPTVSSVPVATASPEPGTLSPNSDVVVCTGISNGFLNFRTQPSKTGAIINWLPEGKRVIFLEKANTFFPWYKLDVDGVQGFAFGAYLCAP